MVWGSQMRGLCPQGIKYIWQQREEAVAWWNEMTDARHLLLWVINYDPITQKEYLHHKGTAEYDITDGHINCLSQMIPSDLNEYWNKVKNRLDWFGYEKSMILFDVDKSVRD